MANCFKAILGLFGWRPKPKPSPEPGYTVAQAAGSAIDVTTLAIANLHYKAGASDSTRPPSRQFADDARAVQHNPRRKGPAPGAARMERLGALRETIRES